jgi:chromosomal replication initiator protein
MANPWDGYLIGPENALAHAGVLALVRGEPGFSPLVVHGPAGAGKSRLLTGLVAEWLARKPESAVAHLGAETFAALCSEADNTPGGWAELRGRFRTLDLLVLEDLHALERAPLAREELTHTLDALDEAGAAVAVSARDGPGQWTGWPMRLVNRLVGGLAVRVDPPGAASRRRFLLERSRDRKLSLTAEAVDALAEAADGYRTLEGWIARLALDARAARRPVDRAGAEALLAEDGAADRLPIDRVAKAVAAKFGVSVRDLRSASRRRTLVEPRQLAMHLARDLTGLSFAAIGAYFGARDPATVRHSCRTAADRLAADPALAAAVGALCRRWQTGD